MTINSGEARETSFLYQRISVLIQCSAAPRWFARRLHRLTYHLFAYFCLIFKLPHDYIYRGSKK